MKFSLLLAWAIVWGQTLALEESARSMSNEEIDRFFGASASERGAKSQHDTLAKWEMEIESARINASVDSISSLGEMLTKLTNFGQFQVAERLAVYKKAQATLLSIPGHAEYYRDKILSSQEVYKQKPDGPTCHEYLAQQRYGFETLRHLPSPETVRMLGEMLSNDWAPPGNNTAETSEKLPILSLRSAVTLSQLPIKDKPFNQPATLENRAERIEAWRTWYEQIKDGKRTFSFEGDPTEYNLNGPAPKEKLAHIALDRKRDEKRQMRQHTTKSKPESQAKTTSEIVSKPGKLAAILSSLLVLVSLVWYGLRKRRT